LDLCIPAAIDYGIDGLLQGQRNRLLRFQVDRHREERQQEQQREPSLPLIIVLMNFLPIF
jgi:hypothetical protein